MLIARNVLMGLMAQMAILRCRTLPMICKGEMIFVILWFKTLCAAKNGTFDVAD